RPTSPKAVRSRLRDCSSSRSRAFSMAGGCCFRVSPDVSYHAVYATMNDDEVAARSPAEGSCFEGGGGSPPSAVRVHDQEWPGGFRYRADEARCRDTRSRMAVGRLRGR